MLRKLTIAASLALALSTAACSGMPRWAGGDSTGATTSDNMDASGYHASTGDPVGSANSGTGSVTGESGSGREAFSSGEGLD